MKALLSLVLCAVMLILCVSAVFASGEPDAVPVDGALAALVSSYEAREGSYDSYLLRYSDAPRPAAPIIIEEPQTLREEGCAEWSFFAAEAGLYHLELCYIAGAGRDEYIELSLTLDGVSPFSGAELITLPKSWENESFPFVLDEKGNELRPRQQEVQRELSTFVKDSDGRWRGPLSFYLEEGSHSLRFEGIAGEAEFLSLCFRQEDEVPDYEEYLRRHSGLSDSTEQKLKIEGEWAAEKNASSLFPTTDRSRESVSSSHYALTRYNTIGKDTWHTAGQTLTWCVDVPEDGFYVLDFKVKQSQKRGMFSTRSLTVDGTLPYAELGNLQFKNQTTWYIHSPYGENGEPYKLYLTAGLHRLSLEAVLGGEAEILRLAENLVGEMNEWYRRIIVITGSNADSTRNNIDLNRDFLLDQKIPGLLEGFDAIAEGLDYCVSMSEKLYGKGGNSGTILAELARLLRVFVEDPDKIPGLLDHYRGSVSSMATWVLEMRSQPLEMDFFVLRSPGEKPAEAGGSILGQAWFRLRMFLYSFSPDYNTLGAASDERSIDVWLSTSDLAASGIASGRDQAQVIKMMIDDLFTPQTGISVNLSLIGGSQVLTQAVLAGKGPDAALVVSKDTPVNLAMRGALVALDGFPGFEEAKERFMPSAWIPYEYLGQTYAFPETQSYDMLFYRKDIFEELGLNVPETWEELYYTVSVLQQHNLSAGIPENQKTFEALLYQKGGQFYTDALDKTMFDQPEALEAFRQWTGLYAKYSFPLVFDFFNRFRSGDMPLAIMPYTQCNYLSAAAPELRGLWDFAPIPGTRDGGRLNRCETAVGTACVMLRRDSGQKYGDVYAFLDWWTGDAAQARFGRDLENLMGAAARYPTANVNAFTELPWTRKQAESLMTQWEQVIEIPQIPGSYYIARNISFAFRAVVYNYANERETLNKYNREINKEIKRKRSEFGLD